ncbi:GTP cyclohydrolase I FolE [Spirochaeta isovalerica]|uniref:GTP cyclohydrolase 1 n=1 Tax=Spirochaeta isovalerica TaxID=150 RepID=A0A841RBG7_9SPIO|nr:GTP cyclohydrolase I FolE [Spirochaeta isovalerica]MBB6481046.1 GTP cyclohydrolase I [Spirochaeta isovalerica]
MNKERVANLIKELLIEIGEDPDREGLVKTPQRVAEAYSFLTSGYGMDLKTVINDAIFESDANNMIISRDIEVFSLCEHHMLPFYGVAHIGYIAEGRVLGVSKLARIVDFYARRLQIQERLTNQIARAVMDAVGAEGVGVVIEARHMCMMMRGVEKLNSSMITSSVLGSFHNDLATREEFMSLINSRSNFSI